MPAKRTNGMADPTRGYDATMKAQLTDGICTTGFAARMNTTMSTIASS